MKTKLLFFFLMLGLMNVRLSAQSENLLPRNEEFRGAWLATVAGLDWPDVDEPAIIQQIHLIDRQIDRRRFSYA